MEATFVEAFIEASVEVNSLKISTKSFYGSFHELSPEMPILQVAQLARLSLDYNPFWSISQPNDVKRIISHI